MEKKTDRRILRTKRNIREAFVKLIAEKSIADITVTDIAKLADIDRKTFYLHYDNVTDVYQEFEDEVAERLESLLAESEDTDFFSFFSGLNQIMEDNIAFYNIIAKNGTYTVLINRSTDLLFKKLCGKYLKNERKTSPEMLTRLHYASSGIIGVYVDWLRSDKEITLEQLSDSLSEITASLLKNKN